MNSDEQFSQLVGKTLVDIGKSEDVMYFITDTQEKYLMYHRQDCCEDVRIEDICGDLNDLLNSPILLAEEVSNTELPPKDEGTESYTWTFYKLATIKGAVTIRWYGHSNGYYSEAVDFLKISDEYMDWKWNEHAGPIIAKSLDYRIRHPELQEIHDGAWGTEDTDWYRDKCADAYVRWGQKLKSGEVKTDDDIIEMLWDLFRAAHEYKV